MFSMNLAKIADKIINPCIIKCIRKGNEKMASMSTIGELITNIHQYGNSKFYVQVRNPKTACAVKFLVDENGVLNVTQIIESFDKPFWDGDRKNESANLEETIEVVKYSEKDLPIVISTIVFSSFYQERATLTHDEISSKVNTDMAVKKLYQIVYAMLQLSNADLTRWALSNENGIENQLINKASQNIVPEDVSSEQAIANIEVMGKEIRNKLEEIISVWKNTQTIHSEEEYESACKQWDSLYDDHAVLEFSISKKM